MKEIAGYVISDYTIVSCGLLLLMLAFVVILLPAARKVDQGQWDLEAFNTAVAVAEFTIILIAVCTFSALHFLPEHKLDHQNEIHLIRSAER